MVKGRERESVAPRTDLSEWETPAFEEVGVSAEVTAYFGVLDFEDD
ncbi:hypothetical protein Acsp03_53470 [Actinomadura sp. NBRC 104412]|nr:pyrroloquinoline quinone precursor peptide PqqA [Actinomadura sp. NBRC 104412]GLZ07881.1 hypothetical protein Acsp03_53470 [Actinomadura sp. NBRC 104412]